MTTRKPRRTYEESFKKQIVALYKSGKPRKEIIKEFDLSPSAFDKWVKQDRTTGSFKEKDNLSEDQKELIKLKKELKELEMENALLKQVALIFGRKSK